MFRNSMILIIGGCFAGAALGDDGDWVYVPRQRQIEPQQERPQPFDRRDAFREDVNPDYRYSQDPRNRYNDDQGYRRHHDHDQDYADRYERGYRDGYRPNYRDYQDYPRRFSSPPMGYRAPAEYYGLPPVRGFVYPQQPLPRPLPHIQQRRDGRW